MPVTVGTQVGPYEVLGPLGAGGMGEVFRARDPRLGREVAIKVLPEQFARDPERLRRFEHEARAAGALNHPNILAIHDIGTHDGVPYVVSELLEGETLGDRLKAGSLPIRRVLDYAIQTLRGLAAAHEKGIVHRDLKPDNLFLTGDSHLKILDFGLAKLIHPEDREARPGDSLSGSLTETGQILGTAGYMAPEQVRGERADRRSDLFAFGCILYEMLSGKRAFHGDTQIESMYAILNLEPQPLGELRPELPAALEEMVRHCIEKNPVERSQSARDVAFALQAIAAAAGTVARLPSVGVGTEAMAVDRGTKALALRTKGLLIGLGLLAAGMLAGLWLHGKYARAPVPEYQRLTFRRGNIASARFTPDGETIVYSAAWDGEQMRLYSCRADNRESSALPLPEARLLAISSVGEMAIAVGAGTNFTIGPHAMLARVPISGGAPREVMEGVLEADWSPDGKELAVVRGVGGKVQVEYPIGRILRTTNSGLVNPRVSPRGDRVAYIEIESRGDLTRGSVAVTDTQGHTRKLTPVWESIQGLAWSPRGDEVWFTAAETGFGIAKALRAVTLAGRERILANAPGGLTLCDVFGDGRVLLTREDIRLSTVGYRPDNGHERNLSWQELTGANDLSADGSVLLLTESGAGVKTRGAIGLRTTDGSPVINLGPGEAGGLSPDGKEVVAILSSTRERTPPHLALLPTGAGQTRHLDRGPVQDIEWSDWVPDGQHVVFGGNEPGHGQRVYIQDVRSGLPRPFTPEGTVGGWHMMSPDGTMLMATRHDSVYLFPTADGTPRHIPWLRPDDGLKRWARGGNSVFIRAGGPTLPARIERVDLATGARQPMFRLMPSDPAGVSSILQIVMTPDAKVCAYSYFRTLSDLYLVRGLTAHVAR